MIYFRDKLGRQISCAPYEGRSGNKEFSVEVIDKGEVVDHFTLYSQAALDATAMRKGWVAC